MKREEVNVKKRTVTGKQLRKLRREGILPANVYGKDMKSTAVELPIMDFSELYKKVKETGLVDLHLDSQVLPVMIKNVAWSPRDQKALHADFFKVNLTEKISAKIPVVATGEPKAVIDKVGVLLQPLNEIEVEALPTELPEKIEVSVESLAVVGDQFTAGELKLPTGVTLLTEGGELVFKIDELVSEEAVAQEAEEAATAEAASAEGETPAEGEAKAEGEGKAEAKTEEKPQEPSKE